MSKQPKIPVDLILNKLAEGAEKAQDRALKARDVLLGPLDTQIAPTPYDIVYQDDRVKLKHYKPRKKRIETPLLMVYALINRETMLDLQTGRSVVRNLLDEGVEIYMVDWGYPTRKDRFQSIDDHVNVYMEDMVDFIRERNGVPKVNLMGICMGGVFSLIYSALHPEKVRNLITTVTPTHFDTDKGLLHIWAKQLDPDRLTDTFGNLSGDILNLVFLLLNPARLMIDKYVGFVENMDKKDFVENFIRMEKWIFDSPDVPGETFRQFIKDCYHKNLLIQSKMEVGGRRVDLGSVTMPLLNIYGRFDHLVPPEACDKLTRSVGSEDTEDICLDTGHIGIYVSGKCQKMLSPKIARWLMEREGAREKAEAVGEARSARTAVRSVEGKPAARSRRKKTKTSGSQA